MYTVVNAIFNLQQWEGERLPKTIYDVVNAKQELKFTTIYDLLSTNITVRHETVSTSAIYQVIN